MSAELSSLLVKCINVWLMQEQTFHHSQCVMCFMLLIFLLSLCSRTHVCKWLYVAEPLQHLDPIELFQWLPKEHMCILVYLVRVYSLSCLKPISQLQFNYDTTIPRRIRLRWKWSKLRFAFDLAAMWLQYDYSEKLTCSFFACVEWKQVCAIRRCCITSNRKCNHDISHWVAARTDLSVLRPMTHAPQTGARFLAPTSGASVMQNRYRFCLVPDSGID